MQDTEIYWDYVDEKLCEELRGQETKIKVYIADSDEGHAQIDTLNARLAGGSRRRTRTTPWAA